VANRTAGDLKAAYADYTKALKLYPNPQDYINRGEWYYSLGKYTEAGDDFFAALKLDSNNMDAWYSVGKYYYGIKDYGKCLEWLADCITRYPDYSDYYLLRALCYRNMHDYDHVAKNVVQALSIDDNSKAVTMLRELADSAYRQTITELEARHLADPNNTGWIYYIAAVHEIEGEYGKALLMYKKLYDMDEKGSRSKSAAAERIAACWWQLGDNDNAIRFLEEAIALEEDKDEKAKISSELEYVREHSRDYQKNEELESIRKAFFGEN
jgi:tetratricopeptide (TPR) repeat protein